MDPNFVTILSAIPGIGHYIALIAPWLFAAIAIAAVLARFFPPPAKSTGLYAALYFFVNWAAQNSGHAANASAPGTSKLPAGTASVVVFLLATSVVLGGCSPKAKEEAKILAPVAVQVAKTAEPAISSDVDRACDIVTAGADAGAAANPGDQDAQTAKTLAHASCDTKKARAQLKANDMASVQPDGGSANWLIKYVLPMAKIALTVAPLL